MIEKQSSRNQTSPITPGLQPAHPGSPAIRGGARPGAGRPKGTPNKVTNTFRDLLLQTANEVGKKRLARTAREAR